MLYSCIEKICICFGRNPGWVVASANFMIILAFLVGYAIGALDWIYAEHRAGTYYSAAQILLISMCCFFIYRLFFSLQPPMRQNANIWKLGAIGFFYLFLDEIAQIHEKIDFAIHYIFGIKSTEFTDHIDDVVVLLYLIFGGFFLYLNRRVFFRQLRYKKTYALAFILLICMMVVDFQPALFGEAVMFLTNGTDTHRIHALTSFLEDSFKIWGGALILVAVSGTYVAEKATFDSVGDKTAPR